MIRRAGRVGLVGLLVLASCSSDRPASVASTTSVAASSTVAVTTSTASPPTTATPEPSTTTAPATTTSSTTLPATTTTTVLVGVDGEPGLGDPLYPELGNGGIDVEHVDLRLSWSGPTRTLQGSTTLTIIALQPLRSFHLDLAGFTVSAVSVNGQPAAFDREDEELVIRPTAVLPAGMFTVSVDYGGVPDKGADTQGRPLGWLPTSDGAYGLSEPGGAHFWFPSNDHPSDKATYTFHVEAAEPLTAVANGRLVSTESTRPGFRTYTYDAADPMASYLVIVAIGRYRITERTTASGLPLRSVEPTFWPVAGEYLERTEHMIDFFSERFGPYPFESYGLLFARSQPNLAMETQTISLFAADDMHGKRGNDDSFLAHELAHQWFGNAVTLKRWNDTWLNESFATYGEWLWDYRDNPAGLEAIAERYRRSAASDRLTRGTTGHPKPESLFGRQVYNGGAIVLHALRRHVGDNTFFTILQTWVSRYRYKSAGTEDFIAVASEAAGRDLTEMLGLWLDGAELPPFDPA